MSRVKPDGGDKLAVDESQQMGLVPFVIDWGTTPNPATVTPGGVLWWQSKVAIVIQPASEPYIRAWSQRHYL